MRLLGIPTVVDRLVQQAINQVLPPIYDPTFSRRSYGIQPHRSCHDVLRKAQKIIGNGYMYVVDLSLGRFFDTVSHSRLIEILGRTIKDGRVVSLTHKYLRSGSRSVACHRGRLPAGWPLEPVAQQHHAERTGQGAHPLRATLYPLCPDTALIFCKSKRTARRVRESITRYIKTIAQHLRVSAHIFSTRYSEHLGRVECLIYLPFLPL